MRDPNRIGPICDRLKAAWSTVPDWRLGQLMENLRRWLLSAGGQDMFFIEDEELMAFLEQCLLEVTGHD